MKRILKKSGSRKGFTLVEVLATVIVMLLVTEIISLTVQLSTRYYTKNVRDSESQTICAALSASIQEELQYATKVQPTAGANPDENGFYPGYTYYSRAREHGSGCTLVCENGKIYVRKGENDYGLVGSKTYTFDLKAAMDCRWNQEGYFAVDVQVLDGSDVLAQDTFNVYPLNQGN